MTANDTSDKKQFVVRLSVANVHQPAERYSPTGVYMAFDHYEVERRTHLKCISGTEGSSLARRKAGVSK